MSKVRVLPEIVANKIAAGEVVERPASVVKELVENAIDAGGKNIIITVRDEGQYIAVTDDGSGMSGEDARLSIHRHTTSKIYDPQDLHSIKTLGFRGEALASIASVSHMTLLTREKEVTAGIRLDLEGGNVTNIRSAPHPPGTKIEVRHLFYNTPARYKFLKSHRVEMQHIKRVIILQSLVHPEISFQYFVHKQRVLDLPATGEPVKRIRDVFGKTDWEELLPIEYFCDTFSITGFISRPQYGRKDKKHQFLFVNSRPVVDNKLLFGVRLSYQDLMESHRHPFAVIYINIHPELIDVNVHPNKYEIRFKDEQVIFNAVREAVSNKLLDLKGPEKMHLSTKTSQQKSSGISPAFSGASNKSASFPRHTKSLFDRQRPQQHHLSNSMINNDSFVIAGQLFHTYILILLEEEMLLIDQHALHEKVLYYQLKNKEEQRNLLSEFIVPEVLEIEPGLKKIFEEKAIPGLREVGYTVEPFGGDSYVIKTYPVILQDVDHKRLIRDYLENIAEAEGITKNTPWEEYRERLLILSSCKKAVKKGVEMKEAELFELVREYFRAPEKYKTCPHGRPIALKMERKQIDKFFHRDY